MDCPKCNSSEKAKNGIINTRQRYKCKHCSYYLYCHPKIGKEIKDLRSDSQEIEFVELDEMHSYIGMGNDFSTSLLSIETSKQPNDSGKQ